MMDEHAKPFENQTMGETRICSIGEAFVVISFIIFLFGFGYALYSKGYSDGTIHGRKEAQHEIWEQEKNGHPFFEPPQNERP